MNNRRYVVCDIHSEESLGLTDIGGYCGKKWAGEAEL